MPILQVEGLRKTFGSIIAVDGVGFAVRRGEVFTIIGPNGAGKTTTLEMIEGLLEPDEGDVAIAGMTWRKDGEAIKRIIGVQPQTSALFDLLTVQENIDVFQSFYPRSLPMNELLALVHLAEHRNKRVKHLSGGQKQRLAIGLALASDPDILFLDEPTTGLDPASRRNIWDIVLSLKGLGKTVVLTTHYMEEAEKLSDRVAIFDQGRVIALDTPANLVRMLSPEREIELGLSAGDEAGGRLAAAAGAMPAVTRCEWADGRLRLWSERSETSLYHVLKYTSEHNLEVAAIAIAERNLEDVYFAYTGKEWRD